MAITINSLNDFPNEIVEKFLCDNNKDRHYILMLVCRRWHCVIRRWRMSNRLPMKTLTPLSYCAESEALFNLVHKESFTSNFDYYSMLKQVALAGNSKLFIEKITKIPDMMGKFSREISRVNARAEFPTMLRATKNIPLINYIGWGGNLEIIEWYMDSYVHPYQNPDSSPCGAIINQIIVCAVEKGHIDVFKWYESWRSRCSCHNGLIQNVLLAIIKNGYIELI